MNNYPVEHLVCPKGFKESIYEYTWDIAIDDDKMWQWLNSVETFRDNQKGPYHVEFLDPDSPLSPRFVTGVQTNHYGPLLNAAGVIGEIKEKEYRDLHYYYGSYVFSFRLVRPQRLEFIYNKDGKQLKMRLKVFLKPWLQGIWRIGMNSFWPRFGKWMEKAATKETQSFQKNSLSH